MSAFDSSLLTCQRSAYLREGNSRVLSCELLPATNTYRVLLDNSVLYPEGGGQPSDAGTVNGISVLKVAKPVDSSVLERLSEDLRATCVEVELPSAIEPETIVPCTVDWERRYDFMQQHTAQVQPNPSELFNAIFNIGLLFYVAPFLSCCRQALQSGYSWVGAGPRQRIS